MAAVPARAGLFLSWCHRDRALKADLIGRLRPHLAILRGVRVGWWDDSLLMPGEDLRRGIIDQMSSCDYGLLLVSPGYLASDFITRYELPRFAGPAADRSALPALLRPLPFDGSRAMSGLDKMVVFTRRGKAYNQCTGADRDEFAADLATGIRRRILGGQ